MLDWFNKAKGSVVFPNYSMRERVADGCIHAIGIAASLIALTVLLVIGVQSQMTLWVVSLAIYGLALVAMFSCSAGYNLIMHPPKLKEVFRRLDHAAPHGAGRIGNAHGRNADRSGAGQLGGQQRGNF